MAGVLDAMLGLAAPKPSQGAKPGRPKAGAAARPRTPRAAAGTATAKQAAAASRPRRGKAAQGSSFRTADHACEHGQRRYKIFTPGSAAAATTPPPLLIMLHGCGQTPDDFAKGTWMNVVAEQFGLLVAYPAQPREVHANRCWNWFRRGDQGRGAGEPAL
ncbi:MAG TPA: PHB depolymerase family esterase, partial [Paracoccus sp. (in: a-proteobacteria)]|nr:PHB depolymerase family esterase [Paracoccus sp. (in: a-proteobacteria)]